MLAMRVTRSSSFTLLLAALLAPSSGTPTPSCSTAASFDSQCLLPLSALLGASPGSSIEEECEIFAWNISNNLFTPPQQASCIELAATVISLPEGVAEELYGEGGCDGLQTTAAVERLKNYVS